LSTDSGCACSTRFDDWIAVAKASGGLEIVDHFVRALQRRMDHPVLSHMTTCHRFKEWRDPRSFVYFIQAGQAGPIKIGKADQTGGRLRGLQGAHYRELRLLGETPGGLQLERHLHDVLAEFRIRGEWFRPTFPVLATIRMVLVAQTRWLPPDEVNAVFHDCWTQTLTPREGL